ncbi:DUF3883 domain-containing protein [Archangium violaceum]|uniref:protein NO VEIN domain-containing protein n=1 Tax=Archangium violaceum TaxID=83451 RepID=UPI0019523CA5|nr:DUF3883 domain-containing protein [Archangium violaceum]QRN95286.1 DUF3883 domain-containing protein [Archangium violaceum]
MARDALFKPGRESFIPKQHYRDKGSPKDPDDQFMRWINLPRSGMANAPGIRALRYLAKPPFTKLPSVLVLVTKKSTTGGSYNPWDDVIDLEQGTVLYWGDAKLHQRKRFTDFPGNRTLEKIWAAVNAGKRSELPPILHFVKHQSGWVTFTGLCEMTALWPDRFKEKGRFVDNYRCRLRILGSAPIPVSWLHSRRWAGTPEEALRGAPEAWSSWVQGASHPPSVRLVAEPMEVPWAADVSSAMGQGFSSDPRIRKAVELEAMKRAREHFQKKGFTRIDDVSRQRSFDLHARDGEREVFVEVKGTQTAGSRVFLTSKEVEFARHNKNKMALYIFHSMRVREVNGEMIVEGGAERVSDPWDVDSGTLDIASITYSYALP